jgi:hypothetical protein
MFFDLIASAIMAPLESSAISIAQEAQAAAHRAGLPSMDQGDVLELNKKSSAPKAQPSSKLFASTG